MKIPAVRPPELPALTGIRALAALWVLLFHSRLRTMEQIPSSIREFIGLGHAAVCFFFVLSGFILAYNYFPKYTSLNITPAQIKEFWVARVARIYPLYLLGFLLAAIAHYLLGGVNFYQNASQEVTSWVLRISGLHTWWPQLYMEGPNDPSWSLSCEFFFYACFPFLAIPILKLKDKHLVTAAVLACFLSLVGPVIMVANGTNTGSDLPDLGMFLSFNPVFRIPEFILGMILGRLVLQNQLPNFFTKHGSGIFIGLSIILFVLVNSGTPTPLLRYGITTPLFALMILAMVPQSGAVANFLSSKPLIALGKASYALYILHRPIMYGVEFAALRLFGSKPIWASLFSLALIFAASFAAFHFLEEPFQKIIRTWYKSRQKLAENQNQ